jgi:ATP synthase in type III secretion protein N
MTLDALTHGLDRLCGEVHALRPRLARGRVVRAIGTVLRAVMPEARLGELCRIGGVHGRPLLAEIVGLDGDETILAPLGDMAGLTAGAEVEPTGDVLRAPVGPALLGRVLDGLGRPLDVASHGPLGPCPTRAVMGEPPPALQRQRVTEALPLGVRVIDGLITCGVGQRMGIYGEPGGGKSTLLSSLVRGAAVDVVVVALVGERGREVRDFLEHQIDEATRARTVMVVATSDRPAVERLKASYTATTIAESFRDEGLHVLLVLDSITRFARALREVGLAAGEPPTRRGFPPSVMAELPRLMERAGPGTVGSITAFYTVLVEGDGSGDPIAEETRSILDGHIVLSPGLATAGHYPAIDVLASRSRLMDGVADGKQRAAAAKVRETMHVYNEIEFLVQVGEYKAGSDPRSDAALAGIEAARAFLRQGPTDQTSWEDMRAWLSRLTN